MQKYNILESEARDPKLERNMAYDVVKLTIKYATSLPVQHQLCCYCRVYGEESQVYNKHVCRVKHGEL